MPRIRTLACGIAAWVALASTVSAAPVSWFDSQAALTAWYANQLNGAGNIYAPAATAAITNLPVNWYSQAPTPTPIVVQNRAIPAASVAPVEVAASSQSSAVSTVMSPPPAAPTYQADAFINLGPGPYAESSIMTGNAQPWYSSPSASAVYGGTPTADQQADFDRDVLSKVQQTFALSGVDVKLTTDPNIPAAHMMSVVSGAYYATNPNAIGITQVGDSGFSFIDKLNYASNPDQLASAVAHNVAHELMHALGVGTHPDETGGYIDSATADWKLLTDPNAKFSPSAVALIRSAMANGADSRSLGAEMLKSRLAAGHPHAAHEFDGDPILATPVPEPATVAVWMLGLLGGFVLRRRGRRAV
jgi:hypothetical protein